MARGEVEPSDKGARPHALYRAYVRTYAPEVWAEPTPAERALRYWVAWNRRVETVAASDTVPVHRHYVETLTDAALAAELTVVGLPVTAEHVGLVTAAVPTTPTRAGSPTSAGTTCRPGPPGTRPRSSHGRTATTRATPRCRRH